MSLLYHAKIWRRDDQKSVRAQDSVDLVQRVIRIVQVLKHFAHENRVKVICFERVLVLVNIHFKRCYTSFLGCVQQLLIPIEPKNFGRPRYNFYREGKIAPVRSDVQDSLKAARARSKYLSTRYLLSNSCLGASLSRPAMARFVIFALVGTLGSCVILNRYVL